MLVHFTAKGVKQEFSHIFNDRLLPHCGNDLVNYLYQFGRSKFKDIIEVELNSKNFWNPDIFLRIKVDPNTIELAITIADLEVSE